MTCFLKTLAAACLAAATVLPSPAAAQDRFDRASAIRMFDEARSVVDADAGRLWGRSLGGPILIVRREDRLVFANRPASGLAVDGPVFTGLLPDSIGIANTAVSFDDTTWTMLMWPLPADPTARRALIAHELWHRVQDGIGFPMRGGETLHLGTRDGRYWLRLEWRALAAALRGEGPVRRRAIEDALLFRTARHAVTDGGEDAERHLMMNEGLAEYTGWTLAGPTPEEARTRAAERLVRAESLDTFVRSFAYYSGPAWGLLLDAVDPEWRASVGPDSTLARMAAKRIGWTAPPNPPAAGRRAAARYDGVALALEEDRLEAERAERRAVQRERYVDGPTLRLDFGRMNVSFDPGTVDALEDVGRVYPAMTVTDRWGTLEVTGGGLIRSDWSAAVVPAPDDPTGETVRGDGYVLRLADGWALVPGDRPGDYVVAPAHR